jgi:hypothetical protein
MLLAPVAPTDVTSRQEAAMASTTADVRVAIRAAVPFDRRSGSRTVDFDALVAIVDQVICERRPETLASVVAELGRLRRRADSLGHQEVGGFLDACARLTGITRDKVFLEAAEGLEKADRSTVAARVLEQVRRSGGSRPTDVAVALNLPLPDVSRALGHLRGTGEVAVSHSPTDRRARIYTART